MCVIQWHEYATTVFIINDGPKAKSMDRLIPVWRQEGNFDIWKVIQKKSNQNQSQCTVVVYDLLRRTLQTCCRFSNMIHNFRCTHVLVNLYCLVYESRSFPMDHLIVEWFLISRTLMSTGINQCKWKWFLGFMSEEVGWKLQSTKNLSVSVHVIVRNVLMPPVGSECRAF